MFGILFQSTKILIFYLQILEVTWKPITNYTGNTKQPTARLEEQGKQSFTHSHFMQKYEISEIRDEQKWSMFEEVTGSRNILSECPHTEPFYKSRLER